MIIQKNTRKQKTYNGWKIPEAEYLAKCHKLAIDIVGLLDVPVKPANGDTIKVVKEFFDDYLLDKNNCFYIDSIKFKNNINFAALILLQAKIDLLSRLSV